MLHRTVTFKHVLITGVAAFGAYALYKAYVAYEMVYQIVAFLSQVRS